MAQISQRFGPKVVHFGTAHQGICFMLIVSNQIQELAVENDG